MDDDAPLDERSLSRLRWRCRRGLLENDLFIERFFEHHGAGLNMWQARGLEALMDLPDNDLLDLLLRRPAASEDQLALETRKVLEMMRSPNASFPSVGHRNC